MGRRFWEAEAVIFDMDGVVTDTARSHFRAWREAFNEYLATRSAETGEPLVSFTEDDYLQYVDGRPRLDGVRTFLRSREIDLPEGSPGDTPESETVHGLGRRKNDLFLETLREGGAEAYPSTVQVVEELQRQGVSVAVVTSSRNADEVLHSAGVSHLFGVKVDGRDAAELGLAGKPSPETYLEAARRLQIPPSQAVVIEDAVSGVEAGVAGSFGLVVGVARSGDSEKLAAGGADIVVSDVGELLSELHR